MGETKDWKVFIEEAERRTWVDIQHEIIGKPLFEHATDYITELEDGTRVMVRKRDNYIYDNNSYDRMLNQEDVEELRKRALEELVNRKRRVIY